MSRRAELSLLVVLCLPVALGAQAPGGAAPSIVVSATGAVRTVGEAIRLAPAGLAARIGTGRVPVNVI